MQIVNLNLSNFRNFKKTSFDFAKTSLIIGPNGSGKTNILEAIWLLAHAKSFKADEEIELINYNQNNSSIIGKGQDEDGKFELGFNIIKSDIDLKVKKKYFLNKIAKRTSDFAGFLKVVLFAPFDLELISNSPARRRMYLDSVCVQTDKNYHRVLSHYERLLRNRNKLLEKIAQKRGDVKELEFWNQNLEKLGKYITQRRENFLLYCNNFKKEIGNFWWQYLPNQISIDRLNQSLEHDLKTFATSVGPHRDDLVFYLDEENLSKFGSRGEGRMAIIALKLAELGFLREKTDKDPILLLDDIFSELDQKHRAEIEKIIDNQQTIITTAEIDSVPKHIFKKSQVIEL